MNQNQPFSIDINSMMTLMVYMMIMVMMMKMMDKALEEPKERPFMIGGAKLPAGYVPVREYRRTTTEKPPEAPPRITEEEELQEKKTTLENTGREIAREAGVEFVRLDEGWQAEYATPIYWFKDAKGNKIRVYDLEELKGKLALISGEHHSSPGTYITIGDPGKTTFKVGEIVSQEAFDKENERVRKLGEHHSPTVVLPRLPKEAKEDFQFVEYIRDLAKLSNKSITDEEARRMWEAWKQVKA